MFVIFIAYVIVTIVWATIALLVFEHERSSAEKFFTHRDLVKVKRAARNFVASPIWPVTLVMWIISRLRNLVALAFGPDPTRR